MVAGLEGDRRFGLQNDGHRLDSQAHRVGRLNGLFGGGIIAPELKSIRGQRWGNTCYEEEYE